MRILHKRNTILLVLVFAIAFYFLLNLSDILAEKIELRSAQKIISLGPSITKSLYLLGVQDKLIANTIYCISPPQAKNKEKIGTAVEVNIEKVFCLKPDLVLATSLTNPKAKEKLKNLGINVITFPCPKDFKGMCKQFLQLARLVGKVKEAGQIIKQTENRIDSIKKKVKDFPKPKVLIQIGARPLFVANRDYFINDFIEFAGGINIAKGSKSGLYSREKVIKDNPDVIIIATMGIIGEEEKKAWQNYKTLNATKFDRIYIIDSDKLSSPTPESFVDTLEEIVHILHPGE